MSVEQWASDQLHDLLGYSDSSAAAFCVALGSACFTRNLHVFAAFSILSPDFVDACDNSVGKKAKNVQDLVQKLSAADLPNDSRTER